MSETSPIPEDQRISRLNQLLTRISARPTQFTSQSHFNQCLQELLLILESAEEIDIGELLTLRIESNDSVRNTINEYLPDLVESISVVGLKGALQSRVIRILSAFHVYINSPSHRAELIKELIGSKEFQEAIANAVEKSRDEGVLEKEDRTKERDGDLEVSNHRI
jgi:hypothetical protein